MKADEQLEQDLTQLGRLMDPGEDFVNRVMRQIDSKPQQTASIHLSRWFIPFGSAIAALLLIAVGLFVLKPGGKKSTTESHPQLVRSSSEWQTISEQPVTLTGDVPGRLISRQLFERVKWTDPQQHATFERLVPRQKVTLITLENY
jgi:hypothetical protein